MAKNRKGKNIWKTYYNDNSDMLFISEIKSELVINGGILYRSVNSTENNVLKLDDDINLGEICVYRDINNTNKNKSKK